MDVALQSRRCMLLHTTQSSKIRVGGITKINDQKGAGLQYAALGGVLGEVDAGVLTVHPEGSRLRAQGEGHLAQRDRVEVVALLQYMEYGKQQLRHLLLYPRKLQCAPIVSIVID